MKFLYGLGGANVPVIREFDISANDKFEAGKVVTITDVCKNSSTGMSEYAVGVAAEDHSGEKDILNARSNGTKLRVDITDGGVYSVPAPRLTATKTGTSTTLVCASDALAMNVTDGELVLIEKGENSSNTDSVGAVRKLSGVSIADGVATVSVSGGSIPDTGDVYAFLPSYGFKGFVADDKKSFTCTSGSGINLTVIGNDKKTASLEVLIGNRFFD